MSIKGTTIATSTTTDGSYSITLPANVSILVFSYVGFDSYEMNVSGKSTADVVLNLQSTNLNEVVVIGDGTSKRKDLTGAISRIGMAIKNFYLLFFKAISLWM